jgi:hypothetical protein
MDASEVLRVGDRDASPCSVWEMNQQVQAA